jgi:glycosyltransferase involved in cell wall biosynthesis
MYDYQVLVIDSGSTDETVDLARQSGAEVVVRRWEGYGQQKNYAQSIAKNDWVLSLDADERATSELAREVAHFLRSRGTDEWAASFPRKNYFMGQWIRFGGWYPNRLIRLAHRKKGKWTTPHVHEELTIDDGKIVPLNSPIHHFSFSSLQDQVLTNLRFSSLGTEQLMAQGKKGGVFLLLIKPLGKWIETYIVKQGFRDGVYGFVISVNAAYSVFLKYAGLVLKQNEDSDR